MRMEDCGVENEEKINLWIAENLMAEDRGVELCRIAIRERKMGEQKIVE